MYVFILARFLLLF